MTYKDPPPPHWLRCNIFIALLLSNTNHPSIAATQCGYSVALNLIRILNGVKMSCRDAVSSFAQVHARVVSIVAIRFTTIDQFCFVDSSIIISNYFINYYIIARYKVSSMSNTKTNLMHQLGSILCHSGS